jgi:hypothetical protein
VLIALALHLLSIVSLTFCAVLYAVICLSVVCYLVSRVLLVYCVIVVPLPPGKNSFQVKINNNVRECLSIVFTATRHSWRPSPKSATVISHSLIADLELLCPKKQN